MSGKLAALIALMMVYVFLLYYVVTLASVPLGLIIFFTLALASYDCYETIQKENNNHNNSG